MDLTSARAVVTVPHSCKLSRCHERPKMLILECSQAFANSRVRIRSHLIPINAPSQVFSEAPSQVFPGLPKFARSHLVALLPILENSRLFPTSVHKPSLNIPICEFPSIRNNYFKNVPYLRMGLRRIWDAFEKHLGTKFGKHLRKGPLSK